MTRHVTWDYYTSTKKLEYAGDCINGLEITYIKENNGSQSDIGYILVNAGVPQGSILGPLLFLIYIDDLVINIKCMIKLFADDTSLYIAVDNPDTSAVLLNNDLDQINKWSWQWLVSFNPAKTECLTISNKVKKPFHPSVIFDSVHLKEVEFHKHFGVVLVTILLGIYI